MITDDAVSCCRYGVRTMRDVRVRRQVTRTTTCLLELRRWRSALCWMADITQRRPPLHVPVWFATQPDTKAAATAAPHIGQIH